MKSRSSFRLAQGPAILLLALAMACVKPSSTSSSEPSNAAAQGQKVSPAVPAEEFCEAFVESACTWEERCSPVKSAESCQSGYIHLCKQTLSASVLSAIKSGEISYDPAVVATWLDTLSQSSCDSNELLMAPEPIFRPRG